MITPEHSIDQIDRSSHRAPPSAIDAASSVFDYFHTQASLIFMESQVYAMWDFMSLPTLQRAPICVDALGVRSLPTSRRFINLIVLGEESDACKGRSMSHSEITLEAMERADLPRE